MKLTQRVSEKFSSLQCIVLILGNNSSFSCLASGNNKKNYKHKSGKNKYATGDELAGHDRLLSWLFL